MDGLKRRAIISLASSYASQLSTTAAEFATKIVLARLILPAQWGIFAEAMLVLLAADILTDLGLSQHVAREQKRPYGNVLIIRAGMSVLVIALLEVFGGGLSFLAPGVVVPARVLAPLILIKSLGSVPTVFVDRELMVQRSLVPQSARLIIMAGVSIALAAAGLGVWALVAGTLASEAAYSGMMWISVRGHLTLDLTLRHSRRLLAGSRYLFLIAAVGLLLQQGDILVVGTLLDPRTVGLYSMALMIVTRVSKVVEVAIYRIIYPMFCEVSHDCQKLGRIYECTTLAIIAIEAPVYLFLLFHSGFFVSSLLGPRWMPMASILQALAMAGVVNPYTTFGIEVLRATKQDALLAAASITGAVTLVGAGFILASHYGAMGMVAANYLPVGAIFIVVALWRTIRREFLSLTRKLAMVYIVSFIVSYAAFALPGAGFGRHLAGIAAVPVLWAIFCKVYGLTVGRETLRVL